MKWLKFALPTILLFFLVPLGQAHTTTVPTNFYFGIPTYGTYINFSTEQTFDEVYREGSYWHFITLGSVTYKFQVQNANMTITDLFASDKNKLTFIVTATSGTSITEVYVAGKGKPTSVSGASSWSYNSTNKLLTITATHSSPVTITIDWSTVASSSSTSQVSYDQFVYQLSYIVIMVGTILVILKLITKAFK